MHRGAAGVGAAIRRVGAARGVHSGVVFVAIEMMMVMVGALVNGRVGGAAREAVGGAAGVGHAMRPLPLLVIIVVIIVLGAVF